MLVDVTHPDNKSILDEIIEEQNQEIVQMMSKDVNSMFIVEEIHEEVVTIIKKEVVYAQMFFTAEAALAWKKEQELLNTQDNVYFNLFEDKTAQSEQVDF